MHIIYEFEGRLYETNYLSPLDDMIERGLINEKDRSLYDHTHLYELTARNRIIKVWKKEVE